MATMPVRFLIFLTCLTIIQAQQLESFDDLRAKTLSARDVQTLNKLKDLATTIDTKFLSNPKIFYNYTIMCGGDTDVGSRVKDFGHRIDGTIPSIFREGIMQSYVADAKRSKRCPKWSRNLDTFPPTGSMDALIIPEDTPVGTEVYRIAAIGNPGEPLYYFIRPYNQGEMIFNVTTYRDGMNGFIGKVFLIKKLDAELQREYKMLAYAFDGSNLIERFATILVQNIDDEIPTISKSDNKYYNPETNAFEFEVLESASIGHFLNDHSSPFEFKDLDTSLNLLQVRIVDGDSGLATIPFTITKENHLIVTSNLDFENREEYRLMLIVQDPANGFAEERVNIKIKDVPDQRPQFIEPAFENQEFKFTENTLGNVASIKAISQNLKPLGPITYKIKLIEPFAMTNKFTIRYFPGNKEWYLVCTEKLKLEFDGSDEVVKFKIEAVEYDPRDVQKELNTELNFVVRIISGDLCKPEFSQSIYNFEVFENEMPIISEISVTDCDHGVNGRIMLSTSNENFQFKVDTVYREGKPGLEIIKPFDYEKIKSTEFKIFAQSSDHSINHFNTSALVRLEIKGRNEFKPEFVLPRRKISNVDNNDFISSDKMFTFKTEENTNFNLRVKAEDLDSGLDGLISYSIEKINQEDTFEIERKFNQTTKSLDISINGMYLDASSKVPITFIVNAVNQKSESLQLSNEIIINVVPSFNYTRPAYFEEPTYEFDINENELDKIYKLKLINDNLRRSEVEIIKINDKLNLFDFELYSYNSFESNNFENELERFEDENNEEIVYLKLAQPYSVDLDRIYRQNNFNSIYQVTLRVQIKFNPEFFTLVHIKFNLIDTNDNPPVLVAKTQSGHFELDSQDQILALVPRTIKPNTAISFEEDIRFSDLDFSAPFGVESVIFKLNDTRFQVDNQLISSHLELMSKNHFIGLAPTIPFVVNKLTSNRGEVNPDDLIWIEVTMEDNYFARRRNKIPFNVRKNIIKLRIVEEHIVTFKDQADEEVPAKQKKPIVDFRIIGSKNNSAEINLWNDITSLIGQINSLSQNTSQPSFTNNALDELLSVITSSNITINNLPPSVAEIITNLKTNSSNLTTDEIISQLTTEMNEKNNQIPDNIPQSSGPFGSVTIVPTFGLNLYEFQSNESYIGPLGHINAFDNFDEPITDFELLDNQEIFQINRTTGEISLIKHLDYEIPSNRLVRCTVVASYHDQMGNRITNSVPVILELIDLNDNEPIFNSNFYNFTIVLRESITKAGSDIGMVYVKDADMIDHNRLRVNFIDEQDIFGLVPAGKTTNGLFMEFKIVNLRDLDLESSYPLFRLKLQVEDLNGNKNIAHVDMQVVKITESFKFPDIEWANIEKDSGTDNEPVIATDKVSGQLVRFKITINEESKAGQVLLTLKAKTDGKTRPVMSYKMVSESPLFEVNQTTGDIHATKHFEENPKLRSKRSVLFVQAYYNSPGENSVPIWSSVAMVEVDLIKHGQPVFVQPANNITSIPVDALRSPVFQFKVEEMNDMISFHLNETHYLVGKDFRLVHELDPIFKRIRLPYTLDPTGELILNLHSLPIEAFKVIFQHAKSNFVVRLTVEAKDARSELSTTTYLFMEFELEYLFDIYQSIGDLDIKVNDNRPFSKFMTVEAFNEATNSKFVNQILNEQQKANRIHINNQFLTIKQNTPPNTIIASMEAFLEETPIRNLPYTLTISSIESSTDQIDPSVFFVFDNVNKNVKLIRKLGKDFVDRTIRFRLMDTKQLTDPDILRSRYDFSILITDNEMSKPSFTLLSQHNLDVVSVFDFGNELDNLDSSELANFNEVTSILKAYELDDLNKVSASFNLEKTDREVIEMFELVNNATHIIFKKRTTVNDRLTKEFLQDKYDQLNREFFQFGISLSNEFGVSLYTAKLYTIEYTELTRLVQSRTTRFQGEFQRSKVQNTAIKLNPIILVNNPLPVELNIELIDQDLPVTDFMAIKPNTVSPSPDQSRVLLPTECVLYLTKSLETSPTTKLWTNIQFSVQFRTNSFYLNTVFGLLKPLEIQLTINFDNQFAPEVTEVQVLDKLLVNKDRPATYIARMNEGTFADFEFGSIKAVDNDVGDMGRVEYFLIGSSLLSIDKMTGRILINGTLDAENEHSLAFFCYARDMGDEATRKQSGMIEFIISISDVNEYAPMITSDMHFLTIYENDKSVVAPEILGSVSCYDHDVSAKLKLVINSIGYVTNGKTLVPENTETQSYIQNMFNLTYLPSDQSTQKANLILTDLIDFEMLYKPDKSLIKIEFSCTDELFTKKSHILLKIEDINDNAPTFTDTFQYVIEITETNDLLTSLARIDASDKDLSKEFGNDSLVFSIIDCQPDIYKFDVRFGILYSDVIIDADTDLMIEQSRDKYLNDGKLSRDSIDIDCKVKLSDSKGAQGALTSERDFKVRLLNLNDNAPVIKLDDSKENTIEVEEGEKTQGKILAEIEIFDRDGAAYLRCLFGNDLTTYEYFELKTERDINDPFKAWCILQVQDDKYISYDATKKSNYLFDLIVVDTHKLPISPNRGFSRVQMNVHVLSVNNKPPMFLNGDEESFYVLDSAKNGTVVGTVLATDMENQNPEKLIYKLNSTNSSVIGVSGKFELVTNRQSNFHWGTVQLVTKGKLDTKESPYTLIVTAYDGPVNAGTTRSSQKKIKVHVMNKGSVSVWVDKNTGESIDYYMKTINEELLPNTHFLTVQAVLPFFNKKDTEGVEIIYEIDQHVVLTESPVTMPNPYYRINSTTGEIFTTESRLDYEEHDPFKKQLMRDLKIRAMSDDGLHRYVTHVSLEIVDVNDNAPKFDIFSQANLGFLFCVVENSTSLMPNGEYVAVGMVRAVDLDSGTNGEISYTFNKTALNYEKVKDTFEIDIVTGEIFLKSPIDREQNDSIAISLIASDKGKPTPRTTTIDINICVLDVNDNKPIFDPTMPTILFVNENDMKANLTLHATDLDAESNGTVFYYIQEDESNNFMIDPKTNRLVLTRALDYEAFQTINLTIIASDFGKPNPQHNTVEIQINVVDQNDNAPRFSRDTSDRVEIKLPNSIAANETLRIIGQFKAFDLDLSSKYNKVTYKIGSMMSRKVRFNGIPIVEDEKLFREFSLDNLFQVNSEDGTLSAEIGVLNMTTNNYFRIELIAFDQQDQTLSDRLYVTVLFKSVIDTLPELKQMTLITPKELTIPKTVLRSEKEYKTNPYVVYIIQAVDPTNAGLNYYLDSVEESQLRNARDFNKTLENVTTLKINSQNLFKVDMNDGVVRAVQPRTFYSAKFYRLKLRVTLKVDESVSSSGYLIVHIDTSKESLFNEQVFETIVDENQATVKHVFDLREKLIDENSKVEFELNRENSMPTEVYTNWFTLDEKSGIVKTRYNGDKNSENIDYEQHREVLLGVNVLDAKTFDLIETVMLKIKINDVNDNAPVFANNYNYKPMLNEDDKLSRTRDRLMTKFLAVDMDGTLENSKVSYSIKAVEPALFKKSDFEIREMFGSKEYGLYKLAGVDMDRDNAEVKGFIRIDIEASDNVRPGALTANKQILIELVDLNDNPPVVLNRDKFEEEIVLFEDEKLGSSIAQIKAVDMDEGKNAHLKYEIIREKTQTLSNLVKETTKHFGINQLGELFLISELDYERERQIELIIRVSDSSSQPLDIRQTIRIKVKNTNDNRPQFVSFPTMENDGTCRLEIEEGKFEKDRVLFTFKASDADEVDEPFSFEMIEVTTIDKKTPGFDEKPLQENVFNIGLRNGELSLAGNHQLDRETIDYYKIVLRLRDQPLFKVQLETLKECYIHVTDINDNSPKFMPEQIRKNNTVLKVFPLANEVSVINWFGATDIDLGRNASINYQLTMNDKLTESVGHMFSIDNKGYLLLNGHSNSFQLNDIYDFTVIARDNGFPVSMSSKLNLKIEIDENYFRISKTSIDRLDLDTSNNNVLVHLEENSQANTFVADVVVRNSFARSNSTEDSRNQIELKFKLLTCNETFSIDPTTGQITVFDPRLLDYEQIQQFLVTIEAEETYMLNNVRKRRSGEMILIVKLDNVNDNAPVFNQESYIFTLSENILKTPFVIDGESLIHISDFDLKMPTDETLPEFQNSQLNIQLMGIDSHKFRLNRLTEISSSYSGFYRLEALSSFDAEMKDVYEFDINVFDGKTTIKAPLVIRINDVNDNIPRFLEKPQEITIDENLPEGTSIMIFNSTDFDRTTAMNQTFYKITNVDSHKLGFDLRSVFHLDSKTGELIVASSQLLDRELFEFFILTISAYNPENVTMADTLSITIKLRDLNDNVPVFEQLLFTYSLREKSTFPSVIAVLNANDIDIGENGFVTYSIEEINQAPYENKDFFSIDGNNLMLNRNLDLDDGVTPETFTLTILAKDNAGGSSSAEFLIKIIDINDNKPNIISPSSKQVFEVKENNDELISIFTVKAIDPDFSNSPIKYELFEDINEDWQFFTVDNATGEVRANMKFDHEIKREYNLRIRCIDSGIMIPESESVLMHGQEIANSYPLELSTVIEATVRVIDLDDNEPEFSQFLVIKNVSDNLQVGSKIELDTTVGFIPVAHDRDTNAANTNISYFIIKGNSEEKFNLNKRTGELKLVQELERSLTNFYQLEVQATSRGQIIESEITNPLSILKININVVTDRLFIQFAEPNYFVCASKFIQPLGGQLREYQFTELRNIVNGSSELATTDTEYFKRLESSSIFFSRAHLIQRKLKRNVRFSIELVQMSRKGRTNLHRLPMNIVNTTSLDSEVAKSLMNNAMDLKLDQERENLFDIDTYTGKVFINRQYLFDMEYNYGDTFIVTIVATAYEPNSHIALSELENTVTRLFVRITERDYSMIMPVTNNLQTILFQNLNPLKELYVPRLLEADGMVVTIQDLVLSTNQSGVSPTETFLYNIIIQVENNRNHKPANLDSFANVWQNFSMSPVFLNSFNQVREREVGRRNQRDEDLAFLKEQREKPFYLNWMFWLLMNTSILILIIALFCLNCYCLNKMIKKNDRKGGLVIEYPPGYSPLYEEGVLNLNRPETRQTPMVVETEYEDQELVMNILDDLDTTIDNLEKE